MKLKREHSMFFTNPSKACKAFLLPVLLLFVFFGKAQEVSVVVTDGVGAEVTAPGLADDISFTIFRVPNTLTNTTVTYSVTLGTATPGVDFDLLAGSVVLSPFAASAVVTVSGIVDDAIVEGDETVVITITGVSFGATISPTQNTATAVITDNDAGVVSLDTATANFIATVNEDGTLQIPAEFGQFRPVIDKANGTAAPLTVTYTVAGSATTAVDYNLTNAVVLTFTNNGAQLARNIRVAPIEDSFPEPNETVEITLISTDNPLYTIGAPATAIVTIVDNDCVAGITAPPLNAATPKQLCDVASVNLNTFVSGGAPSAPPGSALRWSLIPNPSSAADLVATTASTSDTYYGVYWDNLNSCSSPSLAVELTFSTSPSSGTTTNASACNNADPAFTPRTIDLDDLISGEDIGSWSQTGGASVGAIPNSNVIGFDNRPGGTYEFTYTTTGAVAPCTNSSSTLTITVTDCDPCTAGNVAPILNSNQTVFCGPIPASVALTDYAPNTGPNSNPLKWSSNQTDPIPNIVDNGVVQNPGPGTYYGFYHDVTNNCASPVVALTLASKPVPEVTAVNDGERCGPGAVTLTAAVSLNATINWYNSQTSVVIEGSGANFAATVSQPMTTFWVEATLNDCVSERVPVVATVKAQPSAGIIQSGG
jgi:hypothetical protein